MNTPAQEFPNYPDWLASHSDEAIADLLWRLYAHGSTSLLEQLSGTASPEPALHHLNALELAILHAATEIGASSSPVSVEELTETLAELFDIAGTPEKRRPGGIDIDSGLLSLANWGLVFGPRFTLTTSLRTSSASPHLSCPNCSATDSNTDTDSSLTGSLLAATPEDISPQTLFKIPAHIPPLFDPATEQLWRLADCNRCPIPTNALSTTIDALPPRQRRLLGTLSAAGGVGHSATVQPGSDPDAPLPTMVRQGILDQLDSTTVRLSGRISSYLRRTVIGPIGGSFIAQVKSPTLRTTDAASSANRSHTANDRVNSAAIAVVVQSIQELSELIKDLGSNPLQPLGAGGVGVREINKLARRLSIDVDKAQHLVDQLYLANFLAREFPEPSPADDSGRTYWAITDTALAFLKAPLSTQWAMLLLGWVGSTYATWMLRDNDIRPLSPEAHHDCAAELRSLFCSLFPTAADLNDRTGDPTEELWRLRPALAWHTPQLAWESLLSEASDLGLLGLSGGGAGSAGGTVESSDSVKSPAAPQATSALDALAQTLREMEARIAGGEPMSHHEALNALSVRLSAILPDPVRALIIQSDHTILAPGLLSTGDQNQLARMAEQESSGMASVWRVSKRSLLSAFASGDTVEQIEAFLDSMSPGGLSSVPQSLRYLITDTFRTYAHSNPAHSYPDGLSGSSPSQCGHTALSHVPTPTRILNDPSVDLPGDISQQIAGAVEGFRRTHSASESFDPAQGSHIGDTRTVRAPRDIMAELRMAYSAGTQVRLHYVDYAGAISQEWISIVMMTPSTISAVIDSTGETITIQPHRIAAVDVPR